MEELNNHTTSELLTMLLDGELKGAREAELFSALANDPDLQEQLESQLAVREAIKADTEAFTPPVGATVGVFEKLGYAIPAGSGAIGSFWSNIFNKRVAVTAALLLFGTVGITGILSLNDNDTDFARPVGSSNVANNIVAAGDVRNEAALELGIEKQIPVVSSSEVIEDKKVDSRNTNYASAGLQQDSKADESSSDEAFMSPTLHNSLVANQNVGLNYQNNSQFEMLRSRVESPRYNSMNMSGAVFGNTFYVKGAVNSSETPFQGGFNNLTIGYMRNWKDNFSVGVEFGSEPIQRLFSEDQSTALVSRSKDVYWGALTVKYEADMISFEGISPFAQARFGFGSDFNYMYGMCTGAVWNIETLPIALSAAYEFKNFTYTHLSKSYNLNKSGINIGLHYNF